MIRRLLALWPHRAELLRVVVLFAAIGVVEGVLYSLLTPLLRALLRTNPQFGAATPWLITGVALLAVHWVLTVVSTPAAFAASHSLSRQLQLRIGRRLTTLPLGWFTAEHKTRTAREVAHSASKVGGFMGQFAPRLVSALSSTLTLVAATFLTDVPTALLMLAALPLAGLVMRWSGRVVLRTERTLDTHQGELTGRTLELGRAQAVLRSAGRAPAGGDRMQEALAGVRHAYRRALADSVPPRLAYLAILAALTASAMATTAQRMLSGTLSPAEGTVLLVPVVLVVESLSTVNDLYGGVQSLRVALGRVEDVLKVAPLSGPRGQAAHREGHDVTFENVTFGYGGDRAALRNVSFHCPAGTTTALVGPSGSGKTTVTRLIARFFDVGSGAVRLGGADVRDLPAGELTDQLTVVFQDVYLFDGTIEENIRIARPDATEEELTAAIRAARLDVVVDGLPEGRRTPVGAGGSRLSGGERQRVSLARALLKDAPIILLDEIGSALDPENDALIHQALAALRARRDRTVIIIAHRLETLTDADQFLVLDDGRLTETGPFGELIAREGRFAAMWQQRRHSTGWQVAAPAE